MATYIILTLPLPLAIIVFFSRAIPPKHTVTSLFHFNYWYTL